jgi:hypothetical protein
MQWFMPVNPAIQVKIGRTAVRGQPGQKFNDLRQNVRGLISKAKKKKKKKRSMRQGLSGRALV